LLCVLPGLAGNALAQEYPAKPLRIVTGAPGSTAEFTSRMVAQGLSGPLGQPVIVDPRATGGATLFGEIVARAQPDGYTLLIIGPTLWVGPLFRKAPYDPLKDFAFISIMTDAPNILVVHPSLPVNSVKDLVDLAKANPQSLNYSTSGIGASPHLAAELFKLMTGTRIAHVPYKGAGASIIGLMGGEVQLSFASAASVTAQILVGKVRAIAVTGAKPFALFRELPTIGETVPGYEAGSPIGFFAPARTPAAIIARLNREVVAMLSKSEVKARFLSTGVETAGSTPEQLAAMIKSDTIKWSKVIKEAGIRLD
jgi:tripartite-type tricarboxylate transporter receptor subunit TctC